MTTPKKLRLDELVVQRGLAETRAKAQALIRTGKVRRGTEVLDKPGRDYPVDTPLELLQPPPYVSRGGEKLAAFLEAFPEVNAAGQVVLDVGASTGGFTDCLLQRGAISATCVDVGHGQLHPRLQRDPRVTNLEGTNARHLQPGQLPHPAYAIVVLDLSFISLTKVLPAVWSYVSLGRYLVALVKPQFECEKAEADKARGVIRDEAIRQRVLGQVRDFALRELPGATLLGVIESPVHGADGNVEFLLGLKRVSGSGTAP